MRRTIAAMTAALMVGCAEAPLTAPPVLDESTARLSRNTTVPFRLTVRDGASSADFGGRCGGFPMLTVSIQGVATATHFGRTQVVQSHCQNALTGVFGDGKFTQTAADGSSVSGSYEGYLVPTADPTTFVIHGSWAMRRGTGRFEGTKGSGEAIGEFDAATGATELELVGEITTPGRLLVR